MSDEIKIGDLFRDKGSGRVREVRGVEDGWVWLRDASTSEYRARSQDALQSHYVRVVQFFEAGKDYRSTVRCEQRVFRCRGVVEVNGVPYAFGVQYLRGEEYDVALMGPLDFEEYEEIRDPGFERPEGTKRVNNIWVCGDDQCGHPASWHSVSSRGCVDERCACSWKNSEGLS